MELFGTDPLGLSAGIAGVILLGTPVSLWLLYRTIGRLFPLAPKKPRLSAVMAAVFVCLSIPILIFILAYNYYRISEAMMATLADDVAKAREGSIENVEKMVEDVAGTLRLLAAMVAVDPGFFRTDLSGAVLFRALTSNRRDRCRLRQFRRRISSGGDAHRRRPSPV